MQAQRKDYLDAARATAIISVTFNHAVNRSFSIYSGAPAEYASLPVALTVLKVILYIFSRLGVPLFLMISGTLLLPRDYSKSIGRFVRHNWLQLFVTTELWLAIMFWYLQLSPGSVLHTGGIVKCLIRFAMTLLFLNPVTMGSMWYMEMILCVYLMIPILAEALKRIPVRYFALPIALVTICSFLLPDARAFLNGVGIDYYLNTELSSGNLFSQYAVYLLLGYFISKGLLKRLSTKTVLFGAAASFVATCVFQLWLFSRCDSILYYSSFLLLVISAFLFEIFRRLTAQNAAGMKTARFLADISFGIYFVHICIMEGLEMLMNHFVRGIRHLPRFLILETVSFFGSILIIQLLRRNGWIAKNLFGIKQKPPLSTAPTQAEQGTG